MVQLGQHKAFLEALPGKGRWLPAVVNLHRRDSCCCCCSQGGHACTGGGDDGPAHPSRAMPAGEDTWDEGMLASAVALLNEHHKYQAADHLQVQSASHAAPSQFTCQHERMHAAHCHRIKGCLSHCHRIKGSLSLAGLADHAARRLTCTCHDAMGGRCCGALQALTQAAAAGEASAAKRSRLNAAGDSAAAAAAAGGHVAPGEQTACRRPPLCISLITRGRRRPWPKTRSRARMR